MKVVIEFSETPIWCGIVRNEEKPAVKFFKYTMEPGRDPKPWATDTGVRDPDGLKRAAIRHLSLTYKNAFGPQIAAVTFEDFKREFIKRVQGLMLDHVATGLPWIVPTNFTDEIWTQDFVRKLASQRFAKKRCERKVLRETIARWWTYILKQHPRSVVAHRVNSLLGGAQFSEKRIWDTAYELGLVSERKPGPPQRK